MRRNILLIDDDQSFIDLYTQLLESEFNVESYSSFTNALERVEREPFFFDLVLCDIFMPKMNGFEVYDFFMSHKKFNHLNIIFKTSSLNKAIIDECIVSKRTELISTYMSNDEIIARIKSSLSKSKTIKVTKEENIIFVIDSNERELIYPSLEPSVSFTETEIKLINLFNRKKEPVPKPAILKEIYPKNVVVTDNNLNTTLTNLRKKLGLISCTLKTIRNVGTTLEIKI